MPAANPSHGSYHWTFERLISVGLIPLTIAPFAAGSLNPIMDAILCGTILIHSHIGFESCIVDYIPSKRLPKTRLLFWWGLRAATVLVGVGLYEFETNDVGVTEAIKRIWIAWSSNSMYIDPQHVRWTSDSSLDIVQPSRSGNAVYSFLSPQMEILN